MKNLREQLKYRDLIGRMTLEEKASLMSGANFWNTKAIDRLGIASVMLTDGPHGLRKQGGKADHLGLNDSIPATCFPTAATLANSWSSELLREVGVALGAEAAAENVAVLLGPGLNIARDPLGGRNFEYYSEDPYISGELAAAMVEGIQSTGVAACPKHFAVNSQEHLRMSIDEIVDERTMRELYLEGFRRVVTKARPKAIMSSYNKVNGTYANESTHLLQDILRNEWNFDGVVVTDWGGNNDRVAGLIAGNQLEMPSSGGVTDAEIVAAVQGGELDEKLLDQRVDELLALVLENGAPDVPVFSHDDHHTLAIEAARQSIVLLQNNEGALPLASAAKIAVIGDFAQTPRYQGAGSSLVNPTRIDTALDSLEDTDMHIVGYEPGFRRAGGRSSIRLRRALRLASQADTVLVFLGLPEASEAEGSDRAHMRLPDNQLQLMDALIGLDKEIIVVLAGGAPVELPFADSVQAIVHGFLGGQGGAVALADILIGNHSPGGKLAMSYPFTYGDAPTAGNYPGKERTAEHREALFVGYRYYDTRDVPVRYPFGHGLSYTSFSYSDMQVDEHGVSCVITNTGSVRGSEIVQLYIAAPEAKYYAPRHELKGFTKISLRPGEVQRVRLEFDEHTFAYFNEAHGTWMIEAGERLIEIGASSRDIRLTSKFFVDGEAATKSDADQLPSYYSGDVKRVSREEFSRLVGRDLPVQAWDRKAPLAIDDTIRQLSYQNWLGRLCYRGVMLARSFLFFIGRPIKANNIMFIVDMPLSKIERMSGGKISRRKVERFMRRVSRYRQ